MPQGPSEAPSKLARGQKGFRASLVAETVKNLPVMQEMLIRSLGWEDPLEKEMATHSSILAWRIHEYRRLAGYSPWGHQELDITERLSRQTDKRASLELDFSKFSQKYQRV